MEEIKQGYKQTDIGVIPEDWEVKTICDGIAEVKSGKRLPMGYYVSDTKSEHPYIRVIDMMVGGIDTSDIKYVPNEAYPPISNYRIFVDDIFISVAGTLGLVGKIPKELDGANLTENANRLTRINCNRDYLMYYLLSPLIQNVILSEQTIGAQPKLALNRIRNFQIGLPPTIQEQTAIATALCDTDALIAALDKKIAKKQQIKQGAMQQLLTSKKRLPGFSGEWVEKTIWEIAEKNKIRFNDGDWIESPYITNEGIRLIQTGNIGIGLFKDKTDKKFISAESFEKLSCKEVLPNDILICRLAEPAGRTCLAPQSPVKMITSVDVSIFRPNDDLYDRHFLLYVLNTPKWFSEINDRCGGSTRTRIARMQLGNISITLPQTKPEQTAIAQILTDMDNEIAQLEKERDKYKELKAGMMQVLLTGKIRLI